MTTPDGRTLQVPASVARQLNVGTAEYGSQAPIGPIGPMPAPPPPPPPPPKQIGPGLAAEELAAGPQVSPPVTADVNLQPAGVDSMGNPMLAQPEASAPSAPAGADYKVAAPQKPKQTKASKQAQGAAAPAPTPIQAAQAQGDAARQQEINAVTTQADAEAAGQLMIGDAYKKRNEQLDPLFKQQAEEANLATEEQNKKLSEAEAIKKKIAGTKIDRKSDHPILSAIAIALGGIGSAYNKQDVNENPAYKAFLGALERKVAGQQADLDNLHKTYGMTKDEVQMIREKWTDRRAMTQVLIAAECDKAAKSIEEMTARTNSQTLKANGERLAAQIRERGANATLEGVKYQMDFDQKDRHHKAQIGLGYSQLKQSDRHHNDEMQFKREQLYVDFQKALAQERATKGDAAMKQMYELQKENEQKGIRNANDATMLLTPRGRAMMSEADKLDAEAKQIKASQGPLTQAQAARADMLAEKASAMRGEAQIREALRHRDPTQAGALSAKYTATQTITSLTDDIKNLYDTHDRSYFKTGPGQAAIQAKQTELLMALKNAWQLGVLSKQDTALLNQATGGDATKGWEPGNIAHLMGIGAGTDPEAFKARLDSIASGAQDIILADMNGIGYGGNRDDLFVTKHKPEFGPVSEAAAKVQAGNTPGEEAGAQENASGARKVLNRVVYSAGTSNDERVVAKENQGSAKHVGFSKDQAAGMDVLYGALKSGDPKQSGKAAEKLIKQATSPREDLSLSTLHSLRDNAPDLYNEAKSRIAPDSKVGQQIAYEDNLRKTNAQISTAKDAANRVVLQAEDNLSLGQKAIVGDGASFDELSARALKGDPQAKEVLQGVIGNRRRQGAR